MARGTLQDLLRLLENSTPEFSGRLIEALDDALLTAIFLNTEKAGRSLATLNFSLNALSKRSGQNVKLEEAIGAERLARLLVDAATLGAVCDVLRSLSDKFRDACLGVLLARPFEKWRPCVLRAEPEKRFFELCEWMAEAGREMQHTAESATTLRAMSDLGEGLVSESSWYALRSGLDCLPPSSEVAEAERLRRAIAARISRAQATDFAEADWDDLANLPHLIWQPRSDLHRPWAERVVERFDADIGDADIYARWEPGLLFWLHSEAFSADNVNRIVRESLQPARVKAFFEADNPVALFLHLWNTVSVAYQRQVSSTPANARCWLEFVHKFGEDAPCETESLLCEWVGSEASKPLAATSYGPLLQLLGIMQLFGWKLPVTRGLAWKTRGRKFSVWKCMAAERVGFVLVNDSSRCARCDERRGGIQTGPLRHPARQV